MKTVTVLNRVRFAVLGSALVAALTGQTFGAGENLIEREFNPGPGARLEMDVDRGAIEVIAGSGGVVVVKVVREVQRATETTAARILEDHKVEFAQEGSRVTVRSSGPAFSWNSISGLKVEYHVTVPKGCPVDLRTRGGRIAVRDVHAAVEAQTSGGSLAFEGIEGGIVGRTSGGSIAVKGGAGPTDVKTSGGGIRVEERAGDVTARTSGGGIQVANATGKLDTRTSGGSIKATLAGSPTGDCRFSTSGGSIDLTLPAEARVSLEARTSGGRVSSEFGPGDSGSRHRLQQQINGGGPNLIAETSGGGIRIRKR